MKIEITKTELLPILSHFFNLNITDVSLIEVNMVAIIRKTIEQFRYDAHEKIAAIKALRQLVEDNKWHNSRMSLSDAKWTVEHFDAFINFVKTHGRLPIDGYNCGLK